MSYVAKNKASSVLSASLADDGTELLVTTGHGDRFPVIESPDYTLITLENASGDNEVVKVTARAAASDSMTIERAQEGTTALNWSAGDVVELRLTAELVQLAFGHFTEETGAHEASAISVTPTGSLSSSDVQAALEELQTDINGRELSINSATAKTTPVDADAIGLIDSAASNVLKKVTWANVKATLKTYFDGLYLALSGGSMAGLLRLDKSTDITASATTDLGTATGNAVTVTHASGDLAITSFGGASLQAGTRLRVKVSISGGTLTLTYNATSLNFNFGANYKLANGDSFDIVKTNDSLAYWDIENFERADGGDWSKVGELFDWPHASTPSYGLLCNGAAVSRTTYAALFAKIGTTWGVGDGTSTFNLPDIEEGYTTVQANANEGTGTVGEVISHQHGTYVIVTGQTGGGGRFIGTSGNTPFSSGTQPFGGAANKAAGVYVRKCIRF